MDDFERAYCRVLRDIQPIHGEVSSQIEALLKRFVQEMTRESPSPGPLKAALADLLGFLSTPEGRTNATCRAVDAVVSYY
ncbi:MAG: hypothetical protein IT210_13940 [Armatimonadetes bacterium]|nr:hypothetical protein [Armatimonadota bacterium]